MYDHWIRYDIRSFKKAILYQGALVEELNVGYSIYRKMLLSSCGKMKKIFFFLF